MVLAVEGGARFNAKHFLMFGFNPRQNPSDNNKGNKTRDAETYWRYFREADGFNYMVFSFCTQSYYTRALTRILFLS